MSMTTKTSPKVERINLLVINRAMAVSMRNKPKKQKK